MNMMVANMLPKSIELGINMNTLVNFSVFAVALAALGGWIANIVKLVYMFGDNIEITTMFVGRILGIFLAPLGAILGYM